MKKLLTIIPASLILAACANGPMQSQSASSSMDVAKTYDRSVAEEFVCDDNGTVSAKYSLDGEQALLNVSLPNINWMNQTFTLDIARSASGALYVNSSSPNVTYEWHTKADEGIMLLNWANGNSYSVNCTAK